MLVSRKYLFLSIFLFSPHFIKPLPESVDLFKDKSGRVHLIKKFPLKIIV